MVADFVNHRLAFWRLRDGSVWKHIGSRGTAPGQFTFPCAIALTSSGALVVTDRYRVQVMTVEGAVLCVLDPTEVAGVGQLGAIMYGVAVFPETDEILVTDNSHRRVVSLTWTTTQVRGRVFLYLLSYMNSIVYFRFRVLNN